METLKLPIETTNGNVYNILDVMNIMESETSNEVSAEVEMLLAA
jgi:hypothetical protein